MHKKLRLARDFLKTINSSFILNELAKEKLNESHLLLLQTIAMFYSLRESDAIQLVGQNVIKTCYKNGLINKLYFEAEECDTALYKIQEDNEQENLTEIYYVLDFGGLALLDAFDNCSWDELIIPKMYLGTMNKYHINQYRYELYQLMKEKQAKFEFTSQPPPIYLFQGILRFHAVMIVERQTEIHQKLLLGITFFNDTAFPNEKEKAAILTCFEQFFRGETIKKVCASYHMVGMESNFFILIICDTKEQALRVAAMASYFSTKNAVNKFRFIIQNDNNYGMKVFQEDGQLLKYEAGEFRKTLHKFFPK